MVLIAENTSGKGVYDTEKRIIHNSFQGPAIIENGMHIFEYELKFIQTHAVYGLFIDTRKLYGSFSQVNTYLEEVYFPEMKSHGLQYVAIIVSFDIFSQFSLENMIRRMGSLEIRTYYRANEGLEWLEHKVAEAVSRS